MSARDMRVGVHDKQVGGDTRIREGEVALLIGELHDEFKSVDTGTVCSNSWRADECTRAGVHDDDRITE